MDKHPAITLRLIGKEDTGDIIRWRNDPEVSSKFIYREKFDRKTHEKWLKEQIGTGKAVQFIIIRNDSGRKIGSVYLRDINPQNSSAEIGIFIGEKESRGLGFGSQALEQTIKYGFKQLGLHRIRLRVLGNNMPALKLYKKLGFRVEGLAEDMVCLDGNYQNVVFMAKIREES